ncbi:hypothetical protein [Bradyrhizobium sp. Bra64]|uniref:hypothetical protein n=1 Tax=Bradyrhizobium sp. Bra64 TaxID=2926009 RepID=UPI0021194FA8|nr:hypothetical protein [Bradyrhizobium sp. Bra64]
MCDEPTTTTKAAPRAMPLGASEKSETDERLRNLQEYTQMLKDVIADIRRKMN